MALRKRHALARKFRAFKRNDSGASAIEFAMISTFLAILLLNVIDIGIFMFRKMEITGAVRAGAQYALVAKDAATDILIQGVVEDSTDLEDVFPVVDSTQCGCSTGGALFTCTTGSCDSGTTTGRKHYYTQIDATYTHTWIFYAGTIDITASSTIRTE